MNYQTTIVYKGQTYETLRDILPDKAPMSILFVGKTPSPKSIVKGHYFQGTRGRYFWKKLRELGILHYPDDAFADDYLLANHCGVTHITKIPREYQTFNEAVCLREFPQLQEKIVRLRPDLLIFTYKNALDTLLSALLKKKVRAVYGFNPEYEVLFHAALFVFPMPGTICTKEEADLCLRDLVNFLRDKNK